jgi:hypothetical protein
VREGVGEEKEIQKERKGGRIGREERNKRHRGPHIHLDLTAYKKSLLLARTVPHVFTAQNEQSRLRIN